MRALTALYRGELTRALGWFEALAGSSVKLPADGGLVHRAALHGANGRPSMARADAALAMCLLGAPDRALAEARKAVAEAARIDDPIGLAITENMLTRVQLFRRDPVADIERSAARQMWLFALRAGLRLSRLAAAERAEARGWIEEALARCAEPSSSAADFVEARALLA